MTTESAAKRKYTGGGHHHDPHGKRAERLLTEALADNRDVQPILQQRFRDSRLPEHGIAQKRQAAERALAALDRQIAESQAERSRLLGWIARLR